MSARFTLTFTAAPEHLDVLGHVNNAVWVQWMEAIATAHWEAVGSPEALARWVWVVTRHEIDYRGKVIVSARTTWALIERASGRLTRVPPELAAPFMNP